MGVANDYLEMMEAIAEELPLPPVKAIHIAPYSPSVEKSNKFGAMVLADGTVGLSYTALDDVGTTLQAPARTETLIGVTPLKTARLYSRDSLWERCLGMAAVNAISQFVLEKSGHTLAAMGKTVDQLALATGDHVGMVGFFPPLVEQIRSLGLSLTVVELDRQWLQSADNFEVTLDPRRLQGCNKIICTGTALINQSIDAVLGHCTDAQQVVVVGPTCGCLPDPLFARGVSAVGGSAVPNADAFLARWDAREHWRDTTRRYVLRNERQYPGYRALLVRAKASLD